MNNVWIADNIYQATLDEITSVVNIEDQKEIATYVVNDLIHRYDIWNNVSDWYHTFWELYKHRIHLFIALCKPIKNNDDECSVIKSKKHFDWSEFEWWFIIQMETPAWQISYHLPNEYWNECYFIETVDKANEWDWHDSNAVLERLLLI